MKTHHTGAPTPSELRKRWSQWTAIVELFAWERVARKWVDPVEYRALRQELIATCRSLAGSEPENAAKYQALEQIVLPWLTPQSLERTERELLVYLLNRCREVERELSGRFVRFSVPRRAVPIVLGATVTALLLLWSGRVDAILSGILSRLQDWSTELWIAFKWSTDVQRIFALGIVLLVVSLIAVVRTARS